MHVFLDSVPRLFRKATVVKVLLHWQAPAAARQFLVIVVPASSTEGVAESGLLYL